MAPAVDRGDVKGVGEAIEAQRARKRNDVPAIDQPASETALALAELIEMDLGAVLKQARRDLMLGLLDGDAVDVVDLLADGIIAPAMRRTGERKIITRAVDDGTGAAETVGWQRLGELGHDRGGRGRSRVPFAHHHPADVIDDFGAMLIEAARARIDDSAFAIGIFLEPDDFRGSRQRIAGIDGRKEAAGGIAEIGDGVERNVGDGLAENDMEGEQIVDGAAGIADRLSKTIRRLHGESRPEQS